MKKKKSGKLWVRAVFRLAIDTLTLIIKRFNDSVRQVGAAALATGFFLLWRQFGYRVGAYGDGSIVSVVFYFCPGDLICLRHRASKGEQ